jgi:outer membrane lipoprotein-sorting protein
VTIWQGFWEDTLKLIKPLIFLLIITALIPAAAVFAQEQAENDAAKAAALIREVVNKRGGDAYLKVRTIVSRGTYTPYEKGASGSPQSFVDYVAYPGKERTEFDKGDRKFIQSNSESANWVYDARQKMIRDQKDDQIKQFQQGARYDLENLLRVASQQAGVKLVYLGRREVWRGTFSEAVRIEFTDGGSAILHVDPRAKMPLMTEYKSITEEGTANSESRYYRWVDYNGIQYPTLIDAYRDGKQTSRASFDTIELNVSLPDKLFAKPDNVKEVK